MVSNLGILDDFWGEMKRDGATSIHGCTTLLAFLAIPINWVLLLLGYFLVQGMGDLTLSQKKGEMGERGKEKGKRRVLYIKGVLRRKQQITQQKGWKNITRFAGGLGNQSRDKDIPKIVFEEACWNLCGRE